MFCSGCGKTLTTVVAKLTKSESAKESSGRSAGAVGVVVGWTVSVEIAGLEMRGAVL